MLNILWVEDNFSQQKQQTWFSGRIPDVKTNFVDALEAINTHLNHYDLVVLDIDLENTPHNEEVIKFAQYFGKTEKDFLKESGMFLFLQLIEQGFSKDRIIFLTGNADENISRVDELHKASEQEDDSVFDEIFKEIQQGLHPDKRKELNPFIEQDDIEGLCRYLKDYYNLSHQQEEKNTYNRFCDSFKKAFVFPPKEINKGLNVTKRLNEWLENHEKNYYLVLRRGIIAGCAFLKSHIEKNDRNIQFRDFIKKENNHEIATTDIKNYLDTLAQFFLIKQPNDQTALNAQYRLFLRTLVHEWEENIEPNGLKEKHAGDLSKIRDIYTFAWIMKMTRNWVSHANLLEPLDHQTIAFLFLVNMRAMFKLPKEIQPYEKILLSCISSSPADNLQNLDRDIKYAEECVDGILTGLNINETGHFGNKINAIYKQSTGNPDAESHDFKQFLLQYFWINQKSKLRNLTATSNDFLPKLARHIYNRSFL